MPDIVETPRGKTSRTKIKHVEPKYVKHKEKKVVVFETIDEILGESSEYELPVERVQETP